MTGALSTSNLLDLIACEIEFLTKTKVLGIDLAPSFMTADQVVSVRLGEKIGSKSMASIHIDGQITDFIAIAKRLLWSVLDGLPRLDRMERAKVWRLGKQA